MSTEPEKDLTKKNKNRNINQKKPTIYKFLVYALVLIGIDLLISIFYALQTSSFPDGAVVASAAVGISIASMLAGAFVGFLFGIPKTIQQSGKNKPVSLPPVITPETIRQASEEDNLEEDYQSNTNLEEISDWLTKILVGVGLTQLGSIPKKINDVATTLAPGLGGFKSSSVLAICLMLFNVVGGFLLSYLCTRIFLKNILRSFDKNELKTIALDAIRKQQLEDIKTINEFKKALDALQKSVGETKKDPNNPQEPSVILQPNWTEYLKNLRTASLLTKDQVFKITEDAIANNVNKAGEKDILISTKPILEQLTVDAPDDLAVQYRSKLDSVNSRLSELM